MEQLPPNKYIKKWFALDTSDSRRQQEHTAEVFLEIMHMVTDFDILESLIGDSEQGKEERIIRSDGQAIILDNSLEMASSEPTVMTNVYDFISNQFTQELLFDYAESIGLGNLVELYMLLEHVKFLKSTEFLKRYHDLFGKFKEATTDISVQIKKLEEDVEKLGPEVTVEDLITPLQIHLIFVINNDVFPGFTESEYYMEAKNALLKRSFSSDMSQTRANSEKSTYRHSNKDEISVKASSPVLDSSKTEIGYHMSRQFSTVRPTSVVSNYDANDETNSELNVLKVTTSPVLTGAMLSSSFYQPSITLRKTSWASEAYNSEYDAPDMYTFGKITPSSRSNQTIRRYDGSPSPEHIETTNSSFELPEFLHVESDEPLQKRSHDYSQYSSKDEWTTPIFKTDAAELSDNVKSNINFENDYLRKVTRSGSHSSKASSTIGRTDFISEDVEHPKPTTSQIPELQEMISMLRYEIARIDNELGDEQNQDSEKIAEILVLKHQLQARLVQSLDLLSEAEDRLEVEKRQAQSPVMAALPGASHSDPNYVNLSNIIVRVHDSTPDRQDDDKPSYTATDFKERLVFVVEAERTDGRGGWILTKTYADFQSLYDRLRKLSYAINRTGFPVRSRMPPPPLAKDREKDSFTTIAASASSARVALANELQKWTNSMMADWSTSDSKPVQDFMRPDNLKVASTKELATSSTTARTVYSALKYTGSAGLGALKFTGGAGLGALRYTGSVLKKVASGSSTKPIASTTPNTEIEFSSSIQSPDTHLSSFVEGIENLDAQTTIDDQTSNEVLQQTPTSVSGISTSTTNTDIEGSISPTSLSDAELEIILECVFVTLEEVFYLSDPKDLDKWLRQKGLQTVKNLLRRTYGSTISSTIQTRVSEILSEKTVVKAIGDVLDSMWPNGEYYTTAIKRQEAEGTYVAPLVRSEEQKADDKAKAKLLFVNSMPGASSIQPIVGPHNCQTGLTRMFNMLQHKDINRHLICMILDSIVKCVFSGEIL
ncbi:sorting nexin 25 [Nowakowskiella sp. JEL0078]|nr:sorting nexin 25 [Nowakowskiella sp. JEL0078]